MAVRPEELNEELREEAKKYEEFIDRIIRTKKGIYRSDGIHCTISLSGLSGMNGTHFNFIRDSYLQAGWTSVEMKHDQREGSWLEFKYEKNDFHTNHSGRP